MFIAKVIGNVWATRKNELLEGLKFMVVQEENENSANARTYVAIDQIGAGIGETVLVVTGSSARRAAGNENIPIDAAVVGIIDIVEVDKAKA